MDFTFDREGISTFQVHQIEHPRHVEVHFAIPHLHVNNSQHVTTSIPSLKWHPCTCWNLLFDTYEVIAPRNVYVDDDSVVKAIGMGSIVVGAIVRGKINQIGIKDAFHVNNFKSNLLSMNKLMSNSLKVQFNLKECFVKIGDGKIITIAPHKDNLYKWNLWRCSEQMSLISNGIWHTWALELQLWSFEREGCLYAPKHGDWHDHWQFVSFYILIILHNIHRKKTT